MKNIFAYTETIYNTYPAYISLNIDIDGKIKLSVRSAETMEVSSITLTAEQLKELAYAIANNGLLIES